MSDYDSDEESDPDAAYEREQEEKLDTVHGIAMHLPPGWDIREVAGNHRKPCSDCGSNEWFPGDYYVYDASHPWGTEKYCMDCANARFVDGIGGSSDEEEEDGEAAEEERAHEIADEMSERGFAMYSGVELMSKLGVMPNNLEMLGMRPPPGVDNPRPAALRCECCSVTHISFARYWFCNKDDPMKNQYCSNCAYDSTDDIPDLTKDSPPAARGVVRSSTSDGPLANKSQRTK